MNLGDRLTANAVEQSAAAHRVMMEQQALAGEDALKQLLHGRFFFDYAFRIFEHRLLNGKAAGVVALGGKTFREAAFVLRTYQWSIPPQSNRRWRSEGIGIWTPTNALYPLWEEFEARCKAAGLAPHWSYAYDGGNVESWFELSVTAVTNSEGAVDEVA